MKKLILIRKRNTVEFEISSIKLLLNKVKPKPCISRGFQLAQLVRSFVVEQGTWVQIPPTPKINWCLGLMVKSNHYEKKNHVYHAFFFFFSSLFFCLFVINIFFLIYSHMHQLKKKKFSFTWYESYILYFLIWYIPCNLH